MQNDKLRDDLETLLAYNDFQLNPNLTYRLDNGSLKQCTVKDVQQFNYELLASIADELGMSDLYLNN
ncbi:hypothetical protein [Lactiplantibacillus daowaiensis]|uniref:Uncharacterized protein n=1 Tax=Lactiplantibacillus daowaiensis TaxID=2559918 RepID=A0ABW1RX11_9LACO|nr:hypothetical protein [Lactiplantibacillus daowaiensis]